MANWLKLSQEAWEAASAYVDTNYRPDWDYSLRSFRNEHAAGSKYLNEEYKARSRIYRPKTRSIIRKNEAAGAAALFSNMEVVDLQPGDPDNPMSVASRDAMKAILEYRLGKTLPTFEICMGGIQDAQVTGTVCSYQYWEYQMQNGVKKKDKPCIELRPIENIRLDGGASWIDPVNTSPYFCDVVPMYVCDVRGMMNNKDDKTGQPKWKKLKDDVIAKAKPDVMDTSAALRLGKQQDPSQERPNIKEFDIVWVLRWFMRDSQGNDYTYYTLGKEELLTQPAPIEEVYFHGHRPYVMGYSILETHKALKSSMGTLLRPLQMETNEIANQRIDNVKFVLNKRWIVARGRQADVQSLVRNVPGGVTLTTDPKNDIQESNWPDVTSSSYVEQDRINADMDDLAGNFSPSTKVANNAVNDTLGGSRMAAQGAGLMTDYLLRTIIETWWEKVLRQLIQLEAYYETDSKVLALCAKKAKLFPRYGLSTISDEMLMDEVTLTVNVGMGSSNPNERFQKFIVATKAAIELVNTAPPGYNVEEGIKEIYSNAGYRDGTRFFGDKGDPRLMKAMQVIQKMQEALQGKQMEIQSKERLVAAQIQSNEKIKGAELSIDHKRITGDLSIRQAETAIEAARVDLEKTIADLEAQGMASEQMARLREMLAGLKQAELKIQEQHIKNRGTVLKIAGDLRKQEMQQREAAVAE